ncbi:hypothetical protein CERZMDRAFT_37887, partial [Cercospora zeae-maydis SCOH1-5]
GWRFGVAASAAMTMTVLLINTIFAIWTSLHYGLRNGIGTMYEGDCEVVSARSLGLHLVVNALGSALFGASNYTMQCVMAPTRHECDRAHARGDWLDIGIPSFRNLGRISWRRRIAWVLLALSSVPIHFLYNSTVFKEMDHIESPMLIQGLLGWYRDNVLEVSQLRALYVEDKVDFDRLEVQRCIEIYSGNLLTGHSHALLIVDPTVEVNMSRETLIQSRTNHSHLNRPMKPGEIEWITQRDGTSSDWLLGDMHFDYCVARREKGRCRLQFSMQILVVIIICNLTKMIVMFWHLRQQRGEIFVTFGDALASWLDEADRNTKGHCLIEKTHERRPRRAETELPARRAQVKRRWAAAVDTKQWLVSLTLCLASLCAAAILLGRANTDPGRVTIQEAISTGRFFIEDTSSTVTTALPKEGAKGLIAAILLVNTPQMVLSCCYMAYNGLFTFMQMAHEYSGYAVQRKSLRVTQPRGEQRSTYWLQLPYKYSLPLLITTAVMHWLISQSLFLVRVAPYRADLATGTLQAITDSTADRSNVGASLMPILFGIILGSCMLFAVTGLGFRRLASDMPIAGSCSFAFAAATHRPEEDDKASTLPLMWGEIPRMGTEEVGHCAFTSEEVVQLKPNRKYAGVRQYLGAESSAVEFAR